MYRLAAEHIHARGCIAGARRGARQFDSSQQHGRKRLALEERRCIRITAGKDGRYPMGSCPAVGNAFGPKSDVMPGDEEGDLRRYSDRQSWAFRRTPGWRRSGYLQRTDLTTSVKSAIAGAAQSPFL